MVITLALSWRAFPSTVIVVDVIASTTKVMSRRKRRPHPQKFCQIYLRLKNRKPTKRMCVVDSGTNRAIWTIHNATHHLCLPGEATWSTRFVQALYPGTRSVMFYAQATPQTAHQRWYATARQDTLVPRRSLVTLTVLSSTSQDAVEGIW